MTARVRLTDGVRFELASGETVVLDGRRADGDVNVVSHAHADHLFSSAASPVVSSELTAALAAARGSGDGGPPASHPAVELLPAGHVAGSTAAIVDDGETAVLYTGDCSTRDRGILSGFSPVPADVLVVEATYGRPDYRFPPQDRLEAEILEWLAETADRPVLLVGYALGRAQHLQVLVERSTRDRLFVTEAVAELNEVIEAARPVSFDATTYDPDAHDLGPGDAVVLPAGDARRPEFARLHESGDALKAGFSGWAVDRSFRYRGGYDATFPLSDHCDFRELVSVVEAVDPAIVYTHHGFAEELATELTRRGYHARALKRNQATLADF